MIKKSTYIRNFTAKQRKQMEAVALEQKKDIERLNRIIQYKQNKIDNLKAQLEDGSSI